MFGSPTSSASGSPPAASLTIWMFSSDHVRRAASPAPGSARRSATSYLAINGKTKAKDAAFTFWTEFLSAEGQVFRLQGGYFAIGTWVVAEVYRLVMSRG